MAVITNDIYTSEDAEYLMKKQVLPLERIKGVETGGCPHTAIREDASINLAAIDEMNKRFPELDLILIESGGDNLDLTIYVIDVGMGEEIPRKVGPGITKSDILIINKTSLAPYVDVSLSIMERDTQNQRLGKPFVFTDLKSGLGVDKVIEQVFNLGGI